MIIRIAKCYDGVPFFLANMCRCEYNLRVIIMKFYIVTPSFNSLNWLRNCIRSVADQVSVDVEVHHHVQDGCSNDGTSKFLEEWSKKTLSLKGYTFTYSCEQDNGMYDAINKAWDKMPKDADITAHINSDEQYLPNAFSSIAYAVQRNPRCEVIITTYIVVDAKANYICHRRPIFPHKWTSNTVCEIITCACFHRVPFFVQHGIRFDPVWQSIGDYVMYRELVNKGPLFLVLPNYVTSVFSVTGKNLAWTSITTEEWKRVPVSLIWRKLNPFTYRWCNFKRILRDVFCRNPDSYSIYLNGDSIRTCLRINKPSCRWKLRKLSSAENEILK